MKKKLIIITCCITMVLTSCYKDDNVQYMPEVVTESTDSIDVYFRENFLKPFGTAVRWRWEDKYVDNSKRVTPVLREFCIPMGEFIKHFWIEPFQITQPGKDFMEAHFPPEIVLIGSPMYNSDGQSITLGYADAGARITFTQVNEFDLSNKQWLLMQLRTAEHEFGHIIHQKYNLPNGFKEVSPKNYKSNNWLNLAGDVQASNPRISREAISLGMVTNYGTNDVNEDFCEIVSIYLTSSEQSFNSRYIIHEPVTQYEVIDNNGETILMDPNPDASEVNKGRDIIAIKLKMIKDYYLEKFSIDIDNIRQEIMFRINE